MMSCRMSQRSNGILKNDPHLALWLFVIEQLLLHIVRCPINQQDSSPQWLDHEQLQQGQDNMFTSYDVHWCTPVSVNACMVMNALIPRVYSGTWQPKDTD